MNHEVERYEGELQELRTKYSLLREYLEELKSACDTVLTQDNERMIYCDNLSFSLGKILDFCDSYSSK